MTGNTSKSRVCGRCQTEKPLDKDHYQVVKYFKEGFSFYCNTCDIESKKTKPSKNK